MVLLTVLDGSLSTLFFVDLTVSVSNEVPQKNLRLIYLFDLTGRFTVLFLKP